MKNWFTGVTTLEELKKAYRTLAIKHHPDKGGRTEDMQEINAEFDRLFPLYKLAAKVAGAETHETAEAVRSEFYTVNGWKGVNYDPARDLKTVAAYVRRYVKEHYPAYRFSVRTAYASMCQELHVNMTEAPISVYKTMEQLTREDVQWIIKRAEYNHVWPLTCWSDAEACEAIARIWQDEPDGDWYKVVSDEVQAVANDVDDFVNSFNYSDCDGMIDYFDVNFYFFGCLDGNGKYVKHVPREDKRCKQLPAEPSTSESAPTTTAYAPATVQHVEFNAEFDGVEIYFSGKPSASVRDALKADGWRWHSCKKCWYNRNTEQHLRTLRELTA